MVNGMVLCLDKPKEAKGLKICRGLEGKQICCEVETLNKLKSVFTNELKELNNKM